MQQKTCSNQHATKVHAAKIHANIVMNSCNGIIEQNHLEQIRWLKINICILGL